MRCLYTEAVSYENNACFRVSYHRRNGRGVVDDIGEGLSCYDHVILAFMGRVWRACSMLDVGVDCMRVESVGAEVAGLEDDARAGYCAVIQAADEWMF